MHKFCENWSLVIFTLYEINGWKFYIKDLHFKDFFLYMVYNFFLFRPFLVDGSVFFAAEMLPESDS